jgi:hypothetical protein
MDEAMDEEVLLAMYGHRWSSLLSGKEVPVALLLQQLR